MFQQVHKFFNIITYSNQISAWKSKGLSDESIKAPDASNNSLPLESIHYSNKLRAKFEGSSSKQDIVTFTHRKVVNICIVYKMNWWSCTRDTDFTLGNLEFYLELLK